ncbi:MAG: Conserved cytoplasmic membrane protein, CmpX protein [Microgenomates group bacterium GW2011_GWF2_45_18]|nr:MAG: Conserved cytoplasmic membrane protein, CmpX protein [Microgenomates group bacterium GW2011_GWF1_44_10]KKU01997.1 MAG: Conserved cytoplasmic membrane protein, CmpX protein [Microgenomates group bacterium GW2011_GWF2_45_18]OGJ41183.1 MAG: hypothetical protein A2378_00870 [Candidatus Pacebacteria bacterium RIFOXYB1_FULL_44_10]HAU99017.1 hypothetical protein [Candidatus Paceibacterota bacterium]HAX01268.1 hypothetical protein [Candidatus Paceibacterota bacterium]
MYGLDTLGSSISVAFGTVFAQMVFAFPKILAALVIFLIGLAIAKWIRALLLKGLHAIQLSKGLKDTPVELFLKNAEMGKIEEVIASIMYWMFLLVVLHSTASILGLSTIIVILNTIFGYIPRVISAVLILFFGVLLAGFVESVVKGAIRSVSGQSARLFGKVSSYLIMVMSFMASIAELKIAEGFISTLFMGFVVTLSLALGLAFGLGGKSVIEQLLQEWYKKTKSELQDEKKK